MRMFVTGGSGFIGKWLVPLLVERGHELLVLTRSAEKTEEIRTDTAQYVESDLRDISRLRTAMKEFRVDALIHLGWEGLPDYSREKCMQNFEYSVDVFSLAAELGCSSILSTGSCWEYTSRKGQLSEESGLGASGFFPAVKNSLRFLGEAIAREKGARFYWLRLFFVYGPGQRSGSLITHIIESIENNRVPQIQAPDNRNDFIFVADAVRGIADVLERRPDPTVYNLGSGYSTSVEEIVRTSYELCRKPYDRNLLETTGRRGDHDFWADISRIGKDIGWQPKYDVTSGIRTTIENLTRAG